MSGSNKTLLVTQGKLASVGLPPALLRAFVLTYGAVFHGVRPIGPIKVTPVYLD